AQPIVNFAALKNVTILFAVCHQLFENIFLCHLFILIFELNAKIEYNCIELKMSLKNSTQLILVTQFLKTLY
ncbi:MAG: hypothetical protein ACOCWG_02170, partial [bacterium]